jgi:hypothetical protein
MAVAILRRVGRALLCAIIGLLVLASAGGAAGRVGVGKMTVTPNRVPAASTNDFTFSFTADSAALKGTTLVDVPRGWTKPQQANSSAAGYVQLQPTGCGGSRIAGIAVRRIVITTKCSRRHLFRLIYHRAVAPLLSADGFVFLTQTRPANARKKTPFKPLGPRKQPVVRVRGSSATGLFITVTSVASAGVPFSATVRAIDQFGNNAADYAGTVTLTSTDPAAALSAPYAYGSTDASQHTFTGLILRTPGTQRIRATDSHGFTIESGPITVSPFSS